MDDPTNCTALVLYTGTVNGSGIADGLTSITAVAGSSEGGALSGDDGGEGDGGPGAASVPAPRFVGLSNQGATCYMNSLLQTLYMTPEFRGALYEWKYEPLLSLGVRTVMEGDNMAAMGPDMDAGVRTGSSVVEAEAVEDPSECIPLQLQRLFGLLQLSARDCVETRALTDSFGWTAQDSFQQHDVQELCRVLFDALESTFQGTVNEKLVNNLYQGSLRDYVTCKECHSESSRLDNFLDVSLVLRPFGSNQTMKSVTESLEYFLKPEVLDGDNQYYCQACDKKVDAVKGLKFERLPYLLSLQLKRFDFDYNTFQRIKLNDEMRFPLVLDMNKYVENPGTGDEGGEGRCRRHQRSDFQRSVSLEKKQLQGLLGKVHDGRVPPHVPGNTVKGETETKGSGGTVHGPKAGKTEMALKSDGEAAVDVDCVGDGGGGAIAGTDPDTDETDKEEGSLDSGASTEAKGGDAHLPELEDYWGIPFQDKREAEDRKPSALGSIGDPPRGFDGTGSDRIGTGETNKDDTLVPEEVEGDALKLTQENGPWVYELFAVLIHSGSALGGHYYAHIKSLGDDAGWFTFNDSRVTPTDEEAVKRAWGGRWGQSSTWKRRAAGAATSGAGSSRASASAPEPAASSTPRWANSAANAYMLMYRRVDPSVNKRHLRQEEVPEHIVRKVAEEDRKAVEAEAEAETARATLASSITVKVRLNGGSEEKIVNGDKRRPLWELVDRAAEAFGVPIVEDEKVMTGSGDVVEDGTGAVGWISTKDSASDGGDSGGGETDLETQDEGKSDDSAAGRSGAVGGDGDGGLNVSGAGCAAVGYHGPENKVLGERCTESSSKAGLSLDRRLVRPREYLVPCLQGAPLEEASSPAELSFGKDTTMCLETREPGVPWLPFNRSDINVGVVRFDRAARDLKKYADTSGRLLAVKEPPRAIAPIFPVLGAFAPKRITRMKASGTVREVRAQLAAFAGTVDERTRVFTMMTESPESTYKVLCPPRSAHGRYRRRLPHNENPIAGDAVGGGGEGISEGVGAGGRAASARGVAFTPEPEEINPSETMDERPRAMAQGESKEMDERPRAWARATGINVATEEAPMIGFTTAKALADSNARKAAAPPKSEAGGDSRDADQPPRRTLGVNEKEGTRTDGGDDEDKLVVLGERGSSKVYTVFVEEVWEGEGECEKESGSLAVQVALDQLNRMSLKLLLTGGLEGPDSIRVDKRWTLDQLRDAIAAATRRDSRSFQLRMQANGSEIRPGPETLRSQGILNIFNLHVSPGRPLERNEEAIVIAPLEVGFAAGLRASPPPSVVKALAGGRAASRFLPPPQEQEQEQEQEQHPSSASNRQGEEATAAERGALGDPSGNGGGIAGERREGFFSGKQDSDFRNVDIEIGLTSTKDCAPAATLAAASFSFGLPRGYTSCAVDSSGSGGVTCSMLGEAVAAGEFCADAVGNIGGSGGGPATAPLSSATGAKINDYASSASVRPDSGPAAAEPGPHASAVWAAAAAAAATASKLAKAEAERLTTTAVEFPPTESSWGDQFTIAVKHDSTVADIRLAVWQEMRRRGLVAGPPDGSRKKAEGDRPGTEPEASLGCSPAALRLREKRNAQPSTILHDSDGIPTRLKYPTEGTPWLLVAQALPVEENLGQPGVHVAAGSSCGGEDKKEKDLGLTAKVSWAGGRGGSCDELARFDAGDRNAAVAGVSLHIPPANAKVIVVQWWDRWEWRLTEKYEAWISPTETVAAVRKRFAEQVGVDPANIRANRCTSKTRLRLVDLRGASDANQSNSSSGCLGLGVASVESGGWNSTSSSSTMCRWGDLDASRGDYAVMTPSISEGDLVLLQDVSQPLKRLMATTEAAIVSHAVDRAEVCDMSSVGSWYSGKDESGGNGNGTTATTTTASASYSSSKPKERALVIRTRRDRLQEGKMAAAAAAAAVATAASAAAATAAIVVAASVAVADTSAQGAVVDFSVKGDPDANGGVSLRGGGGLGTSEGVETEAAPHLLSSIEGTGTVGSDGNGHECPGLQGDHDDGGADISQEFTGGNGIGMAVGGDGGVVSSSPDRVRVCGRGKIEGERFGQDSSGDQTEKDDVWGLELSEREAYADLSMGCVEDDAIAMHSDAEVAEQGGRALFDDLALVE